MRHSEICTLLLCPAAPLESLFSSRFVVFPTPLHCGLCFCASSSWHPAGGICPGSSSVPPLQGECELSPAFPRARTGLGCAPGNGQLGRSLLGLCISEYCNSDLSYSEVIFRTFKPCFLRLCIISCFALGSVGLSGFFGFGFCFSTQHFVLLSFLESCSISRIYFPFDILNS